MPFIEVKTTEDLSAVAAKLKVHWATPLPPFPAKAKVG